MKCDEITREQKQPTEPQEQVYQFSIVIIARSATQLSPFKMDKVEVQFPCLNAIFGNVRQLMLKGLGDTSQLLHVVVDVAMFHTDEMQAMNEILSAPTVNIIGIDGMLNLVEPQIGLAGNGIEWFQSSENSNNSKSHLHVGQKMLKKTIVKIGVVFFSMIGHKIRQYRKELAISQATLATERSITVEAVRNIEKDIGTIQTLQTVLSGLELELTGLPLIEGLGEQLKAIRKSRKVSQRHVCEMTGLTQPTLINMERGRGRLSSFYTVLRFYNTSLSVRKKRRLHYKKGKTDSWNTSKCFLDKIHAVVPKFCLDPATNPDSHVVAHTHYYEEDDGLSQQWNAQNVYLNPPYSTLETWVSKAHEEFHNGNAQTIVALLPCRTNTEYFHTLITPSADVLFIQKRLRFGEAAQQAPFASMLAIWSKTNIIDEFAKVIEGTILRKPEIAAVAEQQLHQMLI